MGIGLCLSGGGYRAMLFHLGALRRLNGAGLPPRLDRISSVSGGSITSGVLAMNWSHLAFDPQGVAVVYLNPDWERVWLDGIFGRWRKDCRSERSTNRVP